MSGYGMLELKSGESSITPEECFQGSGVEASHLFHAAFDLALPCDIEWWRVWSRIS
jgi:hypothetical protein